MAKPYAFYVKSKEDYAVCILKGEPHNGDLIEIEDKLYNVQRHWTDKGVLRLVAFPVLNSAIKEALR